MIRVLLTAALVAAGAVAAGQSVERELHGWTARLDTPVSRYRHNILGDTPEWARLCLTGAQGGACVDLPGDSVFEDVEPRLADMDGDGAPEVVVVESHKELGAALAVYRFKDGALHKTATPNIGRKFRWLAPVGIADFNGDGDMDVAYVDRPHLAKILRVWTWRDGALHEIATMMGVTNHLIRQDFITGGVRDCGDGPEMVVADGRMVRLLAVRFEGENLVSKDLGYFTNIAMLEAAMACR